MALAATLTGVYTTDVNLNNVISQTIAGVNAPATPVQTVANPTLNNPSVSAPALVTTGTAIPGVRGVRIQGLPIPCVCFGVQMPARQQLYSEPLRSPLRVG